ncbi:MAG: hypothetical protein Cons2KO_09960 [Congregibacter sp.]
MHRDGYMNEGSWKGFEAMCLSLLLSPGGAEWWEAEARNVWGVDAVEHFDNAILRADDSTPLMQHLRPEFAAKFTELSAANPPSR